MAIGIDVSEHNGKIQWNITKKYIKFAMLRAGLGHYIPEKTFEYNAQSCERENIPFGVYWFSYALNAKEAKEEAMHCIRTINKFKVIYPVAYDFEYATEEWGEKQKDPVKFTRELRQEVIETFCETVKSYGYTPMVYTNWDYWIYRGTNYFNNKYDIWFAHTGENKPNINCGIWQYSWQGTVPGIERDVDMNNAYIDYVKKYEDLHVNNIEENWIDYYFDFDKNPNSIANYKIVIDSYFGGNVNLMVLSEKYKCDYNLLCFIIKKIKEKREKWQY